MLSAAPASAQVAGSVALQSDYRVRGYSLTEGDPAAILNLSYDHHSGVYLNGSAVASVEDGDPRMVGVVANIGYARRITPLLSLEAGVTRTEYFHGFGGGGAGYTEIYAGISARNLSARLSYSPDYFSAGSHTLYGEVEGTVEVRPGTRLNAHIGALAYLDTRYGPNRPTRYDWRVGATQAIGAFDVYASLSGGGPGMQYYGGRAHNRAALTIGASWAF